MTAHSPGDAYPLANPSFLKSLLQRYGFTLKKQLGQNFLIDERVLQRIVDAAEVSDADGVFEVGPGAGVVTRLAAARALRVIAVEKDASLQPVLAEVLAGFQHVEVRFADVLDLDLRELWHEFAGCQAVRVIANLPYYVTTPILFHLLESGVPMQTIVLMVQREVAQRLLAEPGGKDYGALTVAVRYRCEAEKIALVHPGAFLPAPEVESAIVRLRVAPQPRVHVQKERLFFQVVRAAFAMRRKTLLNALSGGLNLSKADCAALLARAGIDPQRRGETLSIEEFAGIANAWAAAGG